jgi:hypothetical protein
MQSLCHFYSLRANLCLYVWPKINALVQLYILFASNSELSELESDAITLASMQIEIPAFCCEVLRCDIY